MDSTANHHGNPSFPPSSWGGHEPEPPILPQLCCQPRATPCRREGQGTLTHICPSGA